MAEHITLLQEAIDANNEATQSSLRASALLEQLDTKVVVGGLSDAKELRVGWEANRDEITSIIVPNGIKKVGDCAFNNCGALEALVLPDGIESIGENAFYGHKISALIIPDSVSRIKAQAFWRPEQIVMELGWFRPVDEKPIPPSSPGGSLKLGDGVVEIGERAFRGCTFTEVTLSRRLKNIPRSAFSATRYLSSIHIPSNIESLGDTAFYSSGLTKITFDFGVKHIGDNAFRNTYIVGALDLPDSLESIGDFCFKNNIWLTSVRFPRNAKFKEIPNYAFHNCENITEIDIPSNVTNIGYRAFFGCKRVEKVTLPSTIDWIEREALATTRNVFFDRPMEEVKAMDNYPWGLSNTTITCRDGDVIDLPLGDSYLDNFLKQPVE